MENERVWEDLHIRMARYLRANGRMIEYMGKVYHIFDLVLHRDCTRTTNTFFRIITIFSKMPIYFLGKFHHFYVFIFTVTVFFIFCVETEQVRRKKNETLMYFFL